MGALLALLVVVIAASTFKPRTGGAMPGAKPTPTPPPPGAGLPGGIGGPRSTPGGVTQGSACLGTLPMAAPGADDVKDLPPDLRALYLDALMNKPAMGIGNLNRDAAAMMLDNLGHCLEGRGFVSAAKKFYQRANEVRSGAQDGPGGPYSSSPGAAPGTPTPGPSGTPGGVPPGGTTPSSTSAPQSYTDSAGNIWSIVSSTFGVAGAAVTTWVGTLKSKATTSGGIFSTTDTSSGATYSAPTYAGLIAIIEAAAKATAGLPPGTFTPIPNLGLPGGPATVFTPPYTPPPAAGSTAPWPALTALMSVLGPTNPLYPQAQTVLNSVDYQKATGPGPYGADVCKLASGGCSSSATYDLLHQMGALPTATYDAALSSIGGLGQKTYTLSDAKTEVLAAYQALVAAGY